MYDLLAPLGIKGLNPDAKLGVNFSYLPELFKKDLFMGTCQLIKFRRVLSKRTLIQYTHNVVSTSIRRLYDVE